MLRASEEPKSGAVKSDEVECFLSVRNRKHSHSLNSVTCNAVETRASSTYPFTAQKPWEKNDPDAPPRKTLLHGSGITFGSQNPFMVADLICVSHCSLTVNCETCGLVQQGHGILGRRGNPALKGDPRGRRQRGGKEVKASHPSTPLALNARVQLCSDFFLRTSCGSRNNDSRSLPPLSPLKYGNCIIQIQEPLFFFSLPSPVFFLKCLYLRNEVFFVWDNIIFSTSQLNILSGINKDKADQSRCFPSSDPKSFLS